MKGEYHVMVCTNAFGVGIDKCNVRFVLHGTLPSSIEDYAQQMGRCGRDGKEAEAVLFYCNHDVKRAMQLVAPENAIQSKFLPQILRQSP